MKCVYICEDMKMKKPEFGLLLYIKFHIFILGKYQLYRGIHVMLPEIHFYI